jgi:polyhydroxyalkanoate synthesis repressor PhaR
MLRSILFAEQGPLTFGLLQGLLRCVMLRSIRIQSGCSMAAIRIIKKYPNRRLYDTEISSYITIEDVRQLIVDGEDFEVRDAKSGDDLTRTVLLQIISEQEQDGEPVLSTQLLSQIIRFYGDSLQGFMGSYLERSMQLFMEQQQQFRSQMGNLLGQTPWTMMNQLTERNLELWQEFQRNLSGGLGRPTTVKKDAPRETPKSRAR